MGKPRHEVSELVTPGPDSPSLHLQAGGCPAPNSQPMLAWVFWPPPACPSFPEQHSVTRLLDFGPEDVVKGSCSSRNVQVGPINLSRTTFRHMILKWPHRKPAEVGIVLQDVRDVGTGYSLHGVQPARCTACTAVHCAPCASEGLGISRSVSKGPSLNCSKVPETQKETGWSFRLVSENT